MWRVQMLAVVVLSGILADRAAAQARPLARPGCQDVFDDFTVAASQPLSSVLAAKGKRPAEAFGGLRFFDDGAALTQLGSRVIRICSLQFRNRYTWDRRAAEVILLHEFLHTLGLGENPPTSREITLRVAERCGGRLTPQFAPQVRRD